MRLVRSSIEITQIDTYPFSNKIRRWVVQECLEDGHQSVLVLSKKAEGDLAGSPEGAYTAN